MASISRRLARYQLEALGPAQPSPWADWAVQSASLTATLANVRCAADAGLRALVVLDLDLTTLLAPEVACKALASLVPRIGELEAFTHDLGSDGQAWLLSTLRAEWGSPGSGPWSTLIPSYTDGGIEGYAAYLTAVLQQRLGRDAHLDAFEAVRAWVQEAVHSVLRNGYWDRDVRQDTPAPGLASFLGLLYAHGGQAVFLSNRPPSTRDATLEVLSRLLEQVPGAASRADLFAFLGPGGSAYDASSKRAAVSHLEAGAAARVYIGTAAPDGVIYGPVEYGDARQLGVVAVVDDREGNRQQIITAAAASAQRLRDLEMAGILSVGVATVGHAPEMSIVDCSFRVSDFRLAH